jgi:hypothetical protein
MRIKIETSEGNLFANVGRLSQANEVMSAILKRNYWSNLFYEICFDSGNSIQGSIDLEPRGFHGKLNPFTTHLETFWSNILKSQREWEISKGDKEYFFKLFIDLKNCN